MSKRHKMLISLFVREAQIKTTVRYLYALTKISKLLKRENNCWKEYRVTIPGCCWQGKITQSFWKTVWQFLIKLNLRLSHDLAIPRQNIYSKNECTCIRALFTMAQTRNYPSIINSSMVTHGNNTHQEHYNTLSSMDASQKHYVAWGGGSQTHKKVYSLLWISKIVNTNLWR